MRDGMAAMVPGSSHPRSVSGASLVALGNRGGLGPKRVQSQVNAALDETRRWAALIWPAGACHWPEVHACGIGRARQAVPLQPLHPLQPQCIVSSNPPASGRAGLCFLASGCTVPACCGICDIAIAKLLCRTSPYTARDSETKTQTRMAQTGEAQPARARKLEQSHRVPSGRVAVRPSVQIPHNTSTVLDAPTPTDTRQ